MKRNLNLVLAGAALAAGLAFAPGIAQAQERPADRQAQDRNAAAASNRYHDKKYNDDHEWNNREDQAYRIYERDNHRKDIEFNRLKARDQQNYWNWRHRHSDAELKIDIR